MVSLSELLAAMQNGVTAINNLANRVASTPFGSATAVSTTAATAGTITFTSSQSAGFMTVITSSGVSYKVALYT